MKEYDVTDNDLTVLKQYGQTVEATVTEARALIDELAGDNIEALTSAIDNAQSPVFTGDARHRVRHHEDRAR